MENASTQSDVVVHPNSPPSSTSSYTAIGGTHSTLLEEKGDAGLTRIFYTGFTLMQSPLNRVVPIGRRQIESPFSSLGYISLTVGIDGHFTVEHRLQNRLKAKKPPRDFPESLIKSFLQSAVSLFNCISLVFVC